MMGDKMCLFVPILFSVQLLATDADSSIQFIPKAGQSLQEEIYALYYGACYHSSKSTKEEMCLAGAGCWTEQDKIQWGKGSCPANILEIDWDTKQHLPCGKHCASGMKKSLQDQIYALYGGACYYSSKSTKDEMCLAGAGCWTEQDKIQWGMGSCPADTLEIDWDTAQHLPCGKHCAPGLKKAPQDEIYALYYEACYHSSKSTKEEMCLAGAGCWTEQDRIQWGKGSCPANTLEIDWDTSQHLPCGKYCASDMKRSPSIYALYDGACYHSSKSTKDEMCLAGAGCWTEQEKIQWGMGSCPASALEIDWDTAQHLPCGKHCVSDSAILIV